MLKTNNGNVLNHNIVSLRSKRACYVDRPRPTLHQHTIVYGVYSRIQHENILYLPDNNMKYLLDSSQCDQAMRESSKDNDELVCPIRNVNIGYYVNASSQCSSCLCIDAIERKCNYCTLFSQSNCVYDDCCVFDVTQTLMKPMSSLSETNNSCSSVRNNNGEKFVCNASDHSTNEYDGRCCGRTVRRFSVPRVGDGNSARLKAAVGLRKELSMLTVLLALLAIARSKCMLLCRPKPCARQWITLLVVWCVVFGCMWTPTAAQISKPKGEKVCQSVDIRNTVQSFDVLRGCTVVEGFVQILLIDQANETSYANISFPELREITGYLLFYRASGLRSIGKIFPNLSVIRGNELFYNYALVAFEMIHLQEIGLHSLTDILRGGVRFEKNPLLCYVDTIDWDQIAKEAKGDLHYISGNRGKNECPMCPTNESGEVPCPKSPITNQPLCWNMHHCQKVCSKESECPSSCSDNGACCHDNCLGSCYRPFSHADCFVCKDVSFMGSCIKKCPAEHFEYMKRRCVSKAECYNMPLPKELSPNNFRSNTTWKPFNGTCLLDCPPGTEEKMVGGKLECIVCDGSCRVECGAVNVDSIASAQRLRGCTYIKGSIEIQITGGMNIVKELEENLNTIEEIEGYLKVVRSFPLVSLNFLKSLRIIHGTLKLESDKYALVVLDNQNLQELWDNHKHSQLKIKEGRIFFHFNPKLCISKIQQMSRAAGIKEPLTELEVAHNSNGDKVACNVTTLKTRVKYVTASHVLISWEKFEHYEHRSLLGYVIYYTEAPNNNLSLYDGRDACGNDGWRVDDVGESEVNHLLTFLKPYTQYAFYVKTYTIATENSGAQSPIHYFRTEPATPSVPQSVKMYSNSSTELVIKWRPPSHPNGNVTHYIITGYRGTEDQIILGSRNYCHEPITQETKTVIPITDEEEEKSNDMCSCEEKKEIKKLDEDDIIFANHFEDTLLNQVYIKHTRNRRSAFDYVFEETSSSVGVYKPVDVNITVYNSTTVVLSRLDHFTQYTIWIEACREVSDKEKKNNTIHVCSKPAMITDRTLPLDSADEISFRSVKLSNESRGTNGKVEIVWDEPHRPNGIIVTYQIEYRRVDSENYKPTVECITQSQFNQSGHTHTLTSLNPGNYSLRLRATSLAGYGPYTPITYFLIQEESTTHTEVLLGALLGTFIMLAIISLVVLYYRRKYVEGVPNMKLIASVNPEYMSTVYVPDEWEVPRNKVELLRELGQGSFGMVYEGIASDVVEGQPKMRCAIKTVNEHATDRERSEFLNEASVMKAFNTHHVVRLLGVVSQGQPVLVIMELMTNGDLKTYLRSHRPDSSDDPSIQPPTLKRILQMAIEITDGMAYLAAKKFVHRDLAARNCMVADDLTVKIGDFGMTRDIYETDYYRKGTKGLLPVRWMAPESLKDGVFTSRSDVWSYGVVLWEMATLASQPYQGLSNDQVLRYVIDGGVMERPENCPDRLYELMRLCWQHKPASRPSFLDLVTILLADISADFQQVSFYHSTEGCELRAHIADSEVVEDDPATPLRARDLEDFTLGGSDEEEETFRVAGHSPPANFPRFISSRPTASSTYPGSDQVIISLPTNGNKFGNGSAISSPTSPTTANGWIPNRQNGTDTAHSSNSTLKTTQC